MDTNNKGYLSMKIMDIISIIIDDCGKKFTDYEEIYPTALEYYAIWEHCEGLADVIDTIIKARIDNESK